MAMIEYQNHYGRATLEAVTPYRHVSVYRHKDVPEDCLYPLETLEQLVAISENRRMQVSLGFPITSTGFVIHHSSPSDAALCRIVSLEYTGTESAQSVLARPQAVLL